MLDRVDNMEEMAFEGKNKVDNMDSLDAFDNHSVGDPDNGGNLCNLNA